jgi:hypothetical protein
MGQQSGQQTSAKKKPRGKPFAGADDPRMKQNMTPESQDDWSSHGAVSAVTMADDVPEQLGAMRAVAGQSAGADQGLLQREMRTWLKRQPNAFWVAKTRLEEEYLASKKPAALAPEVDEGSEKCWR